MGNILVKLITSKDDLFIKLMTYSRERGWRGYFYATKDKLLEALENNATLHDRDIYSHLEAFPSGNSCWKFRIMWIDSDGGDDVHGFIQNLTIPRENLLAAIGGNSSTFISRPNMPSARIIFDSQKNIRNICKDPLRKRALSKAMRDSFRWNGSKITLYNDYPHSFFFVESSSDERRLMSGGLILHDRQVIGGNGQRYAHYYYSVHT